MRRIGRVAALRRIGFAGAAFLLALGAAEAFARVAPAPSAGVWLEGDEGKSSKGDILLDGSPWLLWELRPGDHEEKSVQVHVNSVGLRDRERGPKTRPRVVVLGDSSVYGFGVQDGEVFSSRLEERLPADFINAAVPGYSTFQALNILDARAMAFDPDVLLVATLWSDNNFDSFVDKDLLAAHSGWEESSAQRARVALEASALFRWVDWLVRVKPQGDRARKVGWIVGNSDAKTGARRVAINDYAANLDGFCERMVDRGGGVVFVILPNREDVQSAVPMPAWGVYRQAMADTAARYGALLVDLPPVFASSGRSADALFLDQMHPTPTGHALIAETVEAALVKAAWPGTPLRVHPSTSPRPLWVDGFEGKGGSTSTRPGEIIGAVAPSAKAGVIWGNVAIPSRASGWIVLDVDRPPEFGEGVLGHARLPNPGPYKIEVPEMPRTAVFHLLLDATGDGPSEDDFRADLGPLPVPADGRVDLDFTTVPAR